MVIGCCLLGSAEGQARAAVSVERVDIPPLPLAQGAEQLALRLNVAIGTDGPWPDMRGRPVHGRWPPDEALRRWLLGTGWIARPVGPDGWRVERAASITIAPTRPVAVVDPHTILVTATKRAQSLADLAMGGQVIAMPDGGDSPATRGTAAIAAQSPGVTLGGGTDGQRRLFLQGVADSAFNGATPATVAVVLDEARVTYAGADPDVRLVDVDRVEVLQGPQGTLYGAGTLAGIYHIVTRRADLATASLHQTVSIESTASGDIGGAASVVANVPVVAGQLGLRVVGYADRSAGWIDTGARRDTNAALTTGARVAVGVKIGADWRVDVSGLHQSGATRDSGYVYASGQLARPDQLPEPSHRAIDHLAMRIDGPVGAAQLTVASGLTHQTSDQTFDATQGADDFGLASPKLFAESYRTSMWDNEVRLSGRLGGGRWLVGLSYFRTRLDRVRDLSGDGGDVVNIDTLHRLSQEAAGFADVAVPFARRWQFDLGARLFRATLDETLAIPTQETHDLHQRRTGISPSAAVSWRPFAGALAYARAATAFRQGAIQEDDARNGDALAGDTLTSGELGWRQALPGQGELVLGGHFTRWNDMQADSLMPNHIIVARTAGTAQIVGGQARLELTPLAHWKLRLAGDIEDAQLVRNGLGFALDDTRLPVVPVYTVQAGVGRDFVGKASAGSIRLDLRQVGPGRLSFDPGLDRRIAPRLETSIGAQWRWRHVDAAIDITNLLNARSDTFAYGNPFRLSAGPQYVPMQPRRIMLTLGFAP